MVLTYSIKNVTTTEYIGYLSSFIEFLVVQPFKSISRNFSDFLLHRPLFVNFDTSHYDILGGTAIANLIM